MNLFFVIIVVAVLLEYVVGLVANALNLKALEPEPPAGMEDVFEPEEYRRSQQYTRTKTRFGFVTSTFNLLVLLAFWFAGGFDVLDQMVRDWGLHSIASGLVYIGILVLAFTFLSLPFSVYSTFVIEERFGFNKTTRRTFFMDQLKGLALAAVLGGLLLAGILAFFEYAGDLAWLYCWIAVTVFSLALQYVAPTWIMPIFNKFTPLESGELRDEIFAYAGKVDFKLANIFVMDGSKRSSKSNAFFTGFGRNKRIALFDTLVEKNTTAEMVAVLAHEIGHYKMKHILKGTAIGIVHMGIIFFLLSLFLTSKGLHDAFFMEEISIYAGLLFFFLLYTPIEMVLSVMLHWVSRKHEYDADRWAVETVEEPWRLGDALKKLAAENLANLAPHPFYVFMNETHPPMQQRVQAIEELQRKDAEGQRR